MQGLLQEWSTQFDHIIIDTSPVVLVSDAVRLSVSADSVILVVRWRHTPRVAFARAQELLTQVNAAVMGVVFNGADLTFPGYSDMAVWLLRLFSASRSSTQELNSSIRLNA